MALAYIAEQKDVILDRVRKRKKTEQAQTRTELQPLLTAARLKWTSGQPVAARAAYHELLALDPAWPAAVESAVWFLCDQANQSRTHGTLVAALADAGEAHTLATGLHTTDPTSPTARRLLSVTHDEMGGVLIRRGQDGDAAKVQDHFTRSLELAEALLKANPGDADAKLVVSASLESLGDFLTSRGQPGDADKALGYFTRLLELMEARLKADPGSAQATHDVSVSLNRLGGFLATRGQPGDAEKALGYFTRSLEMDEALLKANSSSEQATRDVSESLDSLGGFLATRGQRGDADKALGYFTRSLGLREALLKANPGSAQATRHISGSLTKLGGFLAERGQPGDADKALGYFTRSLELDETLLKANPGSAEATQDVLLSLIRLGDLLTTRSQPGDADRALGYFIRSLDLAETLLKANPGSAQATRNVSISLNKLGDLLATRGQPGDADKALGYVTRSNDLLEALLKANPGSAQAMRDVSVSSEVLGDFLATRGRPGDADKALGYFNRSLELREALVKANPGSAEATRDLSVSHERMGAFANRRGDAQGAARHLRAMYDLLKPAIERGMSFDPQTMQLYERLKAHFAK